MSLELSYLSASAAWFFVMVLVQGFFSNREHGPRRLLGNRDAIIDQSAIVQRAKRANQNMIEAMVMTAPLLAIVALADRSNGLTALGAQLFFFGRVAYAFAYWLGLGPIRTLVWLIGLAGTLLVFSQVAPFSGN